MPQARPILLLMQTLISYLDEFLKAFWMLALEGGPFLLFGLVAAGLIRAFLRVEMVARWLGANTVWSAVKAALLGAPLPICSCGVVPAAFALRKQGASRSATLSFLVTTPETGVDSIALTYAFLGPAMTIVRPVAAVVTGISAGVLEMFFGEKDVGGAGETPTKSCCCHHHASDSKSSHCEPETASSAPGSQNPAPKEAHWWTRFVEGQQYAFGPMLRDLAGWMLLGLTIAAAIQVALPADVISTGTARYGLSNWVWYLIMAVVGVPMYVCATMTTPMMAALMLKGLSPGAALVFLLTGPATNVATVGLIRRNLGNRSMLIYLIAIMACAIAFGALVDAAAGVWPMWFLADGSRTAGEVLPVWLAFPLAVLICVLLVQGWLLNRLNKLLAGRHAEGNPPPKLARPIWLSVWVLAGMVLVTAGMQGLFANSMMHHEGLDGLVAQYNATQRPVAAVSALPAGLNVIQAPPVPMTLADLDALTQTVGPDGRPLIWAYQRRMLDLAGFFRGDEKSADLLLPDGKTMPGQEITLFAAPQSTTGYLVEFPLDRWPKTERSTGVVRVTARMLVEEAKNGALQVRLFGNDYHPLRPSDAADLGLMPVHAGSHTPTGGAPLFPLAEVEKLAQEHKQEMVPLPAELLQWNGQEVRVEGYYVFTWQDADGAAAPLVGLHYFDGLCCGVFPGPFNSVLVWLRDHPKSAGMNPGDDPALAGLRYGQKISVTGKLLLPETLPAKPKEPPIVLADAQVARVKEPGLGDVRLVVIVGLGVLLFLTHTMGRTKRGIA